MSGCLRWDHTIIRSDFFIPLYQLNLYRINIEPVKGSKFILEDIPEVPKKLLAEFREVFIVLIVIIINFPE